MAHPLDRELRKLLTGTNDQRRRVGQTLWHFYRSLVFWMQKGQGFHEIARAWSAAGTAVFQVLAESLRELGPSRPDGPLRDFVARLLRQLADDLERGDHMLVPFLRWLETQFPPLTDMIRREDAASRIYDSELADELSVLFGRGKQATRERFVAELRTTAAGLRTSPPEAVVDRSRLPG